MTGDVTKQIVESYLSNRFHKIYHVLKAPHHGTKTYYTNKLPISCNILISTGERFSKISYNYYTQPCVIGDRYCTAGKNHCEIRDNNMKCINGRCFTNKKTIVL